MPDQPVSRSYGWVPDLPDHRDIRYAAPQAILRDLPASVDFRSGMPPVYDQGQLGSCTAQAVGAAVAFDRYRQGLDTSWTPSRLFIYYNERAIEGTVTMDAGAMIRTGVKVVAGRGVCHEPSWPYNPQLFAVSPPRRCYVRVPCSSSSAPLSRADIDAEREER